MAPSIFLAIIEERYHFVQNAAKIRLLLLDISSFFLFGKL
jgi:hypothetical protein